MKNKIVLLAVCLLAFGAANFGQAKKTAEIAPDQVVKNLYAARKSSATDPFRQKKSRVLLDKFFTRQLADLLWRDATSTKAGEFGQLDFDPFFGGTELKITNLVIGKADAQSGIVTVRFRNHSVDEKVRFSLTKENTGSKVWKIDSIMYRDAEDLGSILKDPLTEAQRVDGESRNKMDGDYLVGAVKCNVTTNRSGYWARVKCEDQDNFQVIDTETLTFGTFDSQEKGRRGHFMKTADDGSISEFVDASGKEFKVSRMK